MKFTKKEVEFLLIALQWAEQDRETLARAYDNCAKEDQDVHIRERRKVYKLRQKVRKWLHDNDGKVLLTQKTELSEMGPLKTLSGMKEISEAYVGDPQTRGWIDVIRKGK